MEVMAVGVSAVVGVVVLVLLAGTAESKMVHTNTSATHHSSFPLLMLPSPYPQARTLLGSQKQTTKWRKKMLALCQLSFENLVQTEEKLISR